MTEVRPAGSRLGDRYAVPSGWQVATLVERRAESPTAMTLVLDVPGWPGHLAGQHLDLRLTAPDGYTASLPCLVSAVACASNRRPSTIRR